MAKREIQEVYVAPNVRGQGIGRQLLQEIGVIAQKTGCESLEVTCRINREDAHRFYERAGLKRTHLKFTRRLK